MVGPLSAESAHLLCFVAAEKTLKRRTSKAHLAREVKALPVSA
jgi:hypothetical protein